MIEIKSIIPVGGTTCRRDSIREQRHMRSELVTRSRGGRRRISRNACAKRTRHRNHPVQRIHSGRAMLQVTPRSMPGFGERTGLLASAIIAKRRPRSDMSGRTKAGPIVVNDMIGNASAHPVIARMAIVSGNMKLGTRVSELDWCHGPRFNQGSGSLRPRNFRRGSRRGTSIWCHDRACSAGENFSRVKTHGASVRGGVTGDLW